MGADVRGLDEAVASIRRQVAGAARRGSAAELHAVVDEARRDWPRDTGRSAAQLVPRDTATGADLRLTGYAPYVRRAGSSRPAWQELIADRLDAERAGDRIIEEVRRG